MAGFAPAPKLRASLVKHVALRFYKPLQMVRIASHCFPLFGFVAAAVEGGGSSIFTTRSPFTSFRT